MGNLQSISNASSSWLGLAGKVCVVTGAAGGIGAEVAKQMFQQGAHVALLDQDQLAVDALATGLVGIDNNAIGLHCDVTDPSSIARAAQQVHERLGLADVLVNNAGALYANALMDIDLAQWNQLLSINLSGYLLCAQTFGKQMLMQRSGSMVHIASISASVPQPYSGAYSVSKAGVKMLSQLLSVELGSEGIRSNVVSPAMIRTPMSEVIYQNPEVLKQRSELVPVGRIGTPQDIAQAVLYLASDRSSYVSGQEILVDGALTQTWLGLIPRPGFEKKDAAHPQ